MNNYPITLTFESRPSDLVEIARNMRRLKLDLDPAILAGPPATHENSAHGLIEAAAPHRDYLEDAAQAVIRGEDPAEHLILAAAWNLRPGLAQKITESGRQAYADTLNTNADKIIKALNKQIIQPALKTMQKLDTEHPDEIWNLEAAARMQDFPQAQRIKEHANLLRNVEVAYKIRAALHPDAYDTDAAWALEPGLLTHIGEPQPEKLSWWMQALNADFTPWFPTVSEWEELDQSDEFTEHRDRYLMAKTEPEQLGFISR